MNRSHYFQRLTQYSPGITAYKILRKAVTESKARVESLRAELFSTYISDKDFIKSLEDSFENIDALLEHLRKRRHPVFFLDFIKKDEISDLIKHHYPGSFEQTIEDAGRICEHIFDLLGSGQAFLGESIDWHTDFKVNWTWKRRYHELVNYVEIDRPCDVKVPWELSRCQHFVTLGKAYFYTGDEIYAREFVAQVDDWIRSNPPKLGVNWVCTMDVAIRVINWIWGYYFFRGSSSLTDEFLVNFFKNLLAHGRYIMDNLENKGGAVTNHYLSNLAGLVYLGVLFPEFKEAEKWRALGIRELIREMERQVYPDGVDYEGSISYHRLVTELFISATLLARLNEQSNTSPSELTGASNTFPDWYLERLEKMLDFVVYYIKPGGSAPQIGDSDDGRLHILSNYGNWDRLDHRYLLSSGAVLFNRSDFKTVAGKFHEEALWLLGKDGLSRFDLLNPGISKPKSKAFLEGGFYIMRHEGLYMIVDCLPDNPQDPLGHRHNSRLSFELSAYGMDFVVDPGAYVYTSDPGWRNAFRSTAYHNTVRVNGQEQSEFNPLNLFSLIGQAGTRINSWKNNGDYDFLDAEHNGYERLADPITHRRQIFFNKQEGYWLVKDILTHKIQRSSHQECEFEVNLHFAPVEIVTDASNPLTVTAIGNQGVSIMVTPIRPDGLKSSVEQGWISHGYGTKIEAPVVRYRKLTSLPTELLMIFYPYTNHQPKIDPLRIQTLALTFMKGVN